MFDHVHPGDRFGTSWHLPAWIDPFVQLCGYGVDKFRINLQSIYSLKLQGFCWFMLVHLIPCFSFGFKALLLDVANLLCDISATRSQENEKNQFRRPGGVDEK